MIQVLADLVVGLLFKLNFFIDSRLVRNNQSRARR